MKRLCIYFFYDKDGVVDDYIPYYLQKIGVFFSEVAVVVNGKLTDSSRKKLEPVCHKIILRENKGFDSWAYKEALNTYGFEYIANNFDEVLLNNFTSFGPVGSFEPMFDKMDNTPCDFWGHCMYFPCSSSDVRGLPIPKHLMSYFIMIRKTILQSPAWKEYWETLQPVHDYDEARLHHEFRFTSYFEDRGFKSASFIQQERCKRFAGVVGSVYDAYHELVEEKSPLLKRKVWFVTNNYFSYAFHTISRPNDLMYYIHKHHLYDLKLAFTNLYRTGTLTDFHPSSSSKWRFLRYRIGAGVLHLSKYKKKLSLIPDFSFIAQILNKK